MYQKQKLHAGLQSDCKTCTPDQKPKRRNRDDRPKVERRATTLEGVLRRMIAEEIGEEELLKEQRFALLQKYGMAQVRIDRKVIKPSWTGDKEWHQKLNEWYKATKGLVPVTQVKRTFVRTGTVPMKRTSSKPWSKITHKSLQSPSNPAGIRGVRGFQKKQQMLSKPQGSTPISQ